MTATKTTAAIGNSDDDGGNVGVRTHRVLRKNEALGSAAPTTAQTSVGACDDGGGTTPASTSWTRCSRRAASSLAAHRRRRRRSRRGVARPRESARGRSVSLFLPFFHFLSLSLSLLISFFAPTVFLALARATTDSFPTPFPCTSRDVLLFLRSVCSFSLSRTLSWPVRQ